MPNFTKASENDRIIIIRGKQKLSFVQFNNYVCCLCLLQKNLSTVLRSIEGEGAKGMGKGREYREVGMGKVSTGF